MESVGSNLPPQTHGGGAGDVDDDAKDGSDDGFDTCHRSGQGPGAH